MADREDPPDLLPYGLCVVLWSSLSDVSYISTCSRIKTINRSTSAFPRVICPPLFLVLRVSFVTNCPAWCCAGRRTGLWKTDSPASSRTNGHPSCYTLKKNITVVPQLIGVLMAAAMNFHMYLTVFNSSAHSAHQLFFTLGAEKKVQREVFKKTLGAFSKSLRYIGIQCRKSAGWKKNARCEHGLRFIYIVVLLLPASFFLVLLSFFFLLLLLLTLNIT